MTENKPKSPNSTAVKELNNRFTELKKKRKSPKDLVDLFRKPKVNEKVAKNNSSNFDL